MDANQSRRRTDTGTDPQPTADDLPKVPFVYQPLNPDVYETRFVRIHPAKSDHSLLRCSLERVPFSERPKYEALSYTWGDQKERHRIDVDGGFLDIQPNLFNALCFLRKQSHGGLYWIDTLCISQDDTSERNKQLRMMGTIYSRASNVMVWLGIEYLKFQDRLSELEESLVDNAKFDAKKLAESSEQEESSIVPEGDRVKQEMVKVLCADKYWSRLWIVQEIGKARRLTVGFGRLLLHWEDFMHLIRMVANDVHGPIKFNRMRQEKAHGYSLQKLLEDHQTALCKDPKDKIYGLVGLADDAHGFPLDYNKSLIEYGLTRWSL